MYILFHEAKDKTRYKTWTEIKKNTLKSVWRVVLKYCETSQNVKANEILAI